MSFVELIDHDPKAAWKQVAEWYMNTLFEKIREADLDVTMLAPPDEIIDYLGECFYEKQLQLRSSRPKTIEYPDIDTESTIEQKDRWETEVWFPLVNIMEEVSFNLSEFIHEKYDTQFANDLKSMVPEVDCGVIRGVLLKNMDDQDDASSHHSSDMSEHESDYEPDS